LTDGNLLITETGELLRRMNTKDGYAMKQLINQDFPMSVITGGHSQGVLKRLQLLGLEDIYIGIDDKVPVFNEWCKLRNLDPKSVLYVGDDIPDFKVMQISGYSACPSDA